MDTGNFHVIDTKIRIQLNMPKPVTPNKQSLVCFLITLMFWRVPKTLAIVVPIVVKVSFMRPPPFPHLSSFREPLYLDTHASPATASATVPSTPARPHRSASATKGPSTCASPCLRIVFLIFADPDILDHGGVHDQPTSYQNQIGNDGLGPPVPHGHEGQADEHPQHGTERETREEGYGPLHPEDHLEGHEEQGEEEAEEDDVGRVLQSAHAALGHRGHDGLEDEGRPLHAEGRVRVDGAQRAGRVEHVVLEELEGLVWENAWMV